MPHLSAVAACVYIKTTPHGRFYAAFSVHIVQTSSAVRHKNPIVALWENVIVWVFARQRVISGGINHSVRQRDRVRRGREVCRIEIDDEYHHRIAVF